MKIQIKSDTHNEFPRNKMLSLSNKTDRPDLVSDEADVIVLPGDIVTPRTLPIIIEQYAGCGKPVIYVAGNHDHWGTTIENAKDARKQAFEGTNIIELDCDTHVIEDVAFIGATLWSNLDSPKDAILAARTRDFGEIKEITPEKWNSLHHRHREYIINACNSDALKDKKRVVVTHYLPSFKSTPARFIGDPYNCIFSSNCEDIMHMNSAPPLWIHGHTHNSFDYTCGNTRVVCNPYGYSGYEINPDFNPNLIIEI